MPPWRAMPTWRATLPRTCLYRYPCVRIAPPASPAIIASCRASGARPAIAPRRSGWRRGGVGEQGEGGRESESLPARRLPPRPRRPRALCPPRRRSPAPPSLAARSLALPPSLRARSPSLPRRAPRACPRAPPTLGELVRSGNGNGNVSPPLEHTPTPVSKKKKKGKIQYVLYSSPAAHILKKKKKKKKVRTRCACCGARRVPESLDASRGLKLARPGRAARAGAVFGGGVHPPGEAGDPAGDLCLSVVLYCA